MGSAALQRAYRFGLSTTPTPPPVTLLVAPSGEVIGAEAASEGPVDSTRPLVTEAPSRRGARPRRRGVLRRLLPLALLAFGLLGVTRWRSLPDAATLVASRWDAWKQATVERTATAALRAGDTAVASAQSPHPAPVQVTHDGYETIHGGLLIAPTTFTPDADGSYDLLIHFHGDVGVVRESTEYVGLNAALAIINLGVMSGVYRDAYSGRGLYEELLAEIDRAVAARGVVEPRRRRVALSAWSAGYAAIGSILRNREGIDWLDAILVFDGIHAGWRAEAPGQMNPRPLEAFVDAARAAVAGKMLFSITHSEIEPPSFAGSRDTAAYLLEAVGVRPDDDVMLQLPPHLELRAAEHAVSKRREKRMVPYTETRAGDLHVRGYRGDTREHHMAHLLQMGATALPDLAERWSHPPAAGAARP